MTRKKLIKIDTDIPPPPNTRGRRKGSAGWIVDQMEDGDSVEVKTWNERDRFRRAIRLTKGFHPRTETIGRNKIRVWKVADKWLQTPIVEKEEHDHCKACDCILRGDEGDICRWCVERILKEEIENAED